VKNTCRYVDTKPDSPTFNMVTSPNSTQQRALELLRSITL